eukprot:8600947-Pyramimonas_sp.AAC.1
MKGDIEIQRTPQKENRFRFRFGSCVTRLRARRSRARATHIPTLLRHIAIRWLLPPGRAVAPTVVL